MRRAWLPELTHGVGSLAGLLIALAVVYDLAGIVPGPFLTVVLGLLVSGAPLRRSARAWIEERRGPDSEAAALADLRALVLELGRGPTLRAIADVARARRALPRGSDHAD